MKRICLFLIMAAASLAMTQNADAKIWRVNNNAGKSGVFNVNGNRVVVFADLTSALHSLKRGGANNINTGDTIHIEGSVTAYGKSTQAIANCDTVYKKVVIIGPGYFLSDNSETQHNKESAKVKTLHILPAAAGTIIAGLEQSAPEGGANHYNGNGLQAGYYAITSGINTYGGWADTPADYKLRIEADSVVVSHCKLYYVDLFNKNRKLTNITITKCMFNPGLVACAAGNNQVTNLIISNNFFKNYWDWGITYWYLIIPSNAVLDFRGSTYYNTTNTWNAVWDAAAFPVINPTIQNNTFYSSFSIIAKGCQLYNNLFFPKQAGDYRGFGLYQYADRPHVMRNNIIYNASYWASPAAGGTSYNGSNYGGMFPGDEGGNQYSNITETSWFASSTSLPALDKSFVLSAGSPARSSDNTETKQRGMYGGLAPYVLSGLYTIPAVWEISIPAYPSGEVPSTGFEVRVKVKSH